MNKKFFPLRVRAGGGFLIALALIKNPPVIRSGCDALSRHRLKCSDPTQARGAVPKHDWCYVSASQRLSYGKRFQILHSTLICTVSQSIGLPPPS